MPSNPPPPSILHVGASPSSMDAGLSAALADSFEVCHCNDVYLAIVRLLRPGAEPMHSRGFPAAVIISLDNLEHAELEFFGVVTRFLPDLPILVYGRGDTGELLEQALDLGATGQATEASIRNLAGRSVPPAGAAPADEFPRYEEAERMPPTPTPDAAIAIDESPTAANDLDEINEIEIDESDVEADELAGPVRVPWLRYADGPARSAPPTAPSAGPQANRPDAPIPSSAGDNPERIAQHTPLLTEEELRALMGPDEFDGADTHEHHDEDGGEDGGEERAGGRQELGL